MRTGTVKWFNKRKGYGYITPIDGGFDVYVHIEAVERAGLTDLKEGQKVNFEIVVDRRTARLSPGHLGFSLAMRKREAGSVTNWSPHPAC